MKTATVRSYMAKPGELEQKWWLVDADQKIVGRLASDIAVILMGKHRPTYTPHVDTGDFVIVVNVDKIVFSGKKWEQKRYTWTTGYPGLQTETARKRFERDPARDPDRGRAAHAAEEQAGLQDAGQAEGLLGRQAPAPGPESATQRISDQSRQVVAASPHLKKYRLA